MEKKYSRVYGTYDFSPQEANIFNAIIKKSREIFEIFCYKELILPILEKQEVFIKSIGNYTDIIEKQMFKVTRSDIFKEDDSIVLRPEGTAQVIRYYLENHLYRQSDFYKFFYFGAMFRSERPQKGRLRQFHHIGAEAIGSNSVFLDVEVIILALRILDEIGIKEKQLQINSLGCIKDKEKFRKLLKDELNFKKQNLCEDCKRRLEKNPLRILDCKNETCKNIIKNLFGAGYNLKEYLCESCLKHYNEVINILNSLNIHYTYNPYLVRGLDYYTNTVFEITSRLLGSQDALGAGGRYNNLIKHLGAEKDIPAIGFALGLERMMLVLDKQEDIDKIDIFIVTIGEEARKKGYEILQKLRLANILSDIDYSDKSLKGQLRYAQKHNAKFVLIIGQEELKSNNIILKDMQKSLQYLIKEENIIFEIAKLKG